MSGTPRETRGTLQSRSEVSTSQESQMYISVAFCRDGEHGTHGGRNWGAGQGILGTLRATNLGVGL